MHVKCVFTHLFFATLKMSCVKPTSMCLFRMHYNDHACVSFLAQAGITDVTGFVIALSWWKDMHYPRNLWD